MAIPWIEHFTEAPGFLLPVSSDTHTHPLQISLLPHPKLTPRLSARMMPTLSEGMQQYSFGKPSFALSTLLMCT